MQDEHATPQKPDYSQADAWANLPDKIRYPADVFYVYPTIYSEESPANADIMNRTDLREKVQGLMIAQAGVYSVHANLFAPYYRQTSFVDLDPAKDMYTDPLFRVGADDVLDAFDYYLEHYNEGRPLILASHSQGSLVTIDLMRNRFDDPDLQRKLIAAYTVGYSIMPEEFETYPFMKPAEGEDDIGVVIAYNTQLPGATGSPVLKDGAFCINPLNWKTDGTPAGRELHQGAVFFDDFTGTFQKEMGEYLSAFIDLETGALVTIPPHYEDLNLGNFPAGVLHKFDYAFWYRNLQHNVRVRMDSYFNSDAC